MVEQVKVPLECISAASWEGKAVSPQEWLVQGMIPMHTTTALAGDGGIGKSLLAMQLMTCCGAGKRFLNKDTMPCVSLGLFCEDRENQLHERQSRIISNYSIGYSDIADVHYIPRVGTDNSLVSIVNGVARPNDFFFEFKQIALDIGARLIVIDTAADTFSGNENYRGEVRTYVQLLNGLAEQLQGAVLLLMHPSSAGLASGSGTSGSTAWNNSVRSRYYLKKPEDDQEDANVRILTQMKSNYAAADNTGIELIWDEGAFQLRLDDSSFLRKLEINKIKKQCLELIGHWHAKNVFLSLSQKSTNYAPKVLTEKMKPKPKFKDVKIAIDQLFDENLLINKDIGKPSRPQYILEPVQVGAGPLEDTEL